MTLVTILEISLHRGSEKCRSTFVIVTLENIYANFNTFYIFTTLWNRKRKPLLCTTFYYL